MAPIAQIAKCHPERKHRARGLCDSCYTIWYTHQDAEHLAKYRAQVHNTNRRRATVWTNDQWRDSRLKKYGLSLEGYNQMLDTQGGRCAICGGGNGDKPFQVDHDHESGLVRGLLCGYCNRVLAQARDNPKTLLDAVSYLSRARLVLEHPLLARIGFELHDTIALSNGQSITLPPAHNTIQVSFGVLLAKLASGKDATPLKYVETGSGNPSWDSNPPPPVPSTTEAGLLNPIVRSAAFVPGTDWVYLVTPATTPETVSGSPTSRIRVTSTFAIGVSNGTLREVALYGGNNATSTVGTGDLASVIRHVAINKPSGAGDFSLVRSIIIQFS